MVELRVVLQACAAPTARSSARSAGHSDLDTARRWAREGNGELHEERDDDGRTVSVRWPSVSTLASEPAGKAEAPPPTRAEGPATLCVVDDDLGVLELVSSILRGEGYRVLESASGAGALELFRDTEEAIELLVVDLEMRPMTGLDLVTALRGRHGQVRTLYMSGCVDRAEFLANGIGEANFLQKPFLPRELVDKVQRLLDPDPERIPPRLMFLERGGDGLMARLLGAYELEVEWVESGEEALARAQRPPAMDVLLLTGSSCSPDDLQAVELLRAQLPELLVFDLDECDADPAPTPLGDDGAARRALHLEAALAQAMEAVAAAGRSEASEGTALRRAG